MAKKSQIKKFKEAAREAGTDESEDVFNTRLKEIAKKAPQSKQDQAAPDEDVES